MSIPLCTKLGHNGGCEHSVVVMGATPKELVASSGRDRQSRARLSVCVMGYTWVARFGTPYDTPTMMNLYDHNRDLHPSLRLFDKLTSVQCWALAPPPILPLILIDLVSHDVWRRARSVIPHMVCADSKYLRHSWWARWPATGASCGSPRTQPTASSPSWRAFELNYLQHEALADKLRLLDTRRSPVAASNADP